MTKKVNKPTETKTSPKRVVQMKYSKSAFVIAAKSSKERLILASILEDKKTYTKDEVTKLVTNWKKKGVR